MTAGEERICVGCGDTEEQAKLEPCPVCYRSFCADCAHRGGFGRKFCSVECGRAYYFSGDPDDDENDAADDE